MWTNRKKIGNYERQSEEVGKKKGPAWAALKGKDVNTKWGISWKLPFLYSKRERERESKKKQPTRIPKEKDPRKGHAPEKRKVKIRKSRESRKENNEKANGKKKKNEKDKQHQIERRLKEKKRELEKTQEYE